MTIDSIINGIVLDHISAGKSMEIYDILELSKLDCSVAIIKNAVSKKGGRKDIIKIDSIIDVNLDVLGYIDPGITVNIVKDGKIVKKSHLELPDRVAGVIKCNNPRCITSTEQELPHVFQLADREKGVYRCVYCEAKAGHGAS
ncbi:MAG: aspartate carbamoyltransferase regulatory subunit [Oscillospiraceae bacterium]|nr:aspartate carbamoyltransferase regulatory subunit [Oscillospiraceae bacterium]